MVFLNKIYHTIIVHTGSRSSPKLHLSRSQSVSHSKTSFDYFSLTFLQTIKALGLLYVLKTEVSNRENRGSERPGFKTHIHLLLAELTSFVTLKNLFDLSDSVAINLNRVVWRIEYILGKSPGTMPGVRTLMNAIILFQSCFCYFGHYDLRTCVF